MSNIMDFIMNPNSILVFDIDGVLIKYEFGQRNHNCCTDKEFDENVEYYSSQIYSNAKPVKKIQELLANRNPAYNYVCSVSKSASETAKADIVQQNYTIPKHHIIMVPSKQDKLNVLHQIKKMHPEISDDHIILIDDTIKTLTYVQENSNYSTCHISSFLD